MPFYHKLGNIPPKRHTTFYKPDGESLYREELVSTKGFSDIYSNKYHIYMPTRVLDIKELPYVPFESWDEAMLQPYHFDTDLGKTPGDFISAREIYLYNRNCRISVAHVNQNTEKFFRNASHHEVIFVHYGEGTFHSDFGEMPFGPGDQIVVNRGIIYQMEFDTTENNKLVITESTTPFDVPRHYRNQYGQLSEDAPYCERDIKVPSILNPHDEKGEFPLVIHSSGRLFEYTIDHHPFDVVGWDGYLYPFIFNIRDFAPKVGEIHLPPPVHLVFTTQSFVYCNFCPRLFDFHPDSIPAPYYHHNVDSDEVLYYVEGDFMSREGIQEGSITLHPGGFPHGPQPGKTEASVGAEKTEEYALMVDTFEPLKLTKNVKESMDSEYFRSWIPDDESYC